MTQSSRVADEGVPDTRVEQILEQLPAEFAYQPRYRRTITLLVEAGGREHTSELIRRLASAGTDPQDVDAEQYREIHCWLHDETIPTLCRVGVAEYDGERGALTLTEGLHG